MTRTWDPKWIAEYNTAMREVVANANGTGERVALWRTVIDDAIQAHRPWAHDVDRDARAVGDASEIKRWLKRHRVVIAIGGRTVRKPRVIGTRRPTDDGVVVDLQLPFAVLTFDEIRNKRTAYLRQLAAYTDDVAVMDILLALSDMAPGTFTPQEAASSLGISLDEYLAESA